MANGMTYRGSDADKKRMREYAKIWRKTDKGKKYRKEYYQRKEVKAKRPYNYTMSRINLHVLRLMCLMRYSTTPRVGCSCCGESIHRFLTIDHIEGGGNKHRDKVNRRGSMIYYWLYQQSFPKGYRVLCFNCNCGRALNNGICPHKEILN